MKKCSNKAIALVPWAGKNLKCCKEHVKIFTTLSNVMGNRVVPDFVQGLGNCLMNGEDLEEVHKVKV